LPGTLNRKDERNGRQPVPCELIECDPARHYPFAAFESLAVASPKRQRREIVAGIQLPSPRKLRVALKSKKAEQRFQKLLNACAIAKPGQRSERDFALLCWAIENGLDREELWLAVSGIGKFADQGRDYFDRTLANSEEQTKQKIYADLNAINNGCVTRNGSAPALTPGPGNNGPDGPDEPHDENDDGDDSRPPLPQSDTDPHRLAHAWLARCAQHERPGDCAAYYRQMFYYWEGNRWILLPDHEMRATINDFIHRLLEEEARVRQIDQAIDAGAGG
jgi:hypothetical protein